jgi:glycosidase
MSSILAPTDRPRLRTRWATALLAATVVVAGLTATPAHAAGQTVTLVGSLQSEIGCAADWDPACAASHLDAGTGTWSKSFTVPAGSYTFKIAVNDSWAENYGAGGAKDGPDMPLVLAGSSKLTFSFDGTSHLVTVSAAVSTTTTRADEALARDSLRSALTKERFYFVMADRFANGSTANDTGGLTGSRMETGFDPTDKGFYHGGDLKGLTSKLDYIKGLGTTAIWMTPAFKNRPVQGTGDNASAGYHGYWITDFTQIDPHLGTNEDMQNLIKAAHAKGMKVFFDIITNHTADVIDYAQKQYGYISTATKPYTDAAGNVFDPKAVVNSPTFPTLSATTSFPYTPVFRTPADATVKVPAWLNDVTLYHNRGDSTYAGESSEYGDFSGLDDLFTENPKVLNGFIDVYDKWVDYGVDGFRIDTVKHVDIQFWQKFSPAVIAHAKAIGNKDFFMFGEVYDSNPAYMSTFTTTGALQATLDFGFQSNALAYAQGKTAKNLADFYAADDYYTDANSNAYQLPTFTGNHDMGRVAMQLKSSSTSDADLLARVKLTNSLMYLTRGNPVVYYGDEQGFIGAGGDKDAREDLFATQTTSYATEAVLGGTPGAKDRYDTGSVLYRQIASLARLRAQNPALADGAQLTRYAADGPGIFAFSRIDSGRHEDREYVVAVNNSNAASTATFTVGTSNATLQPLLGATRSIRTTRDGKVTVTVPAMSAVVYLAHEPMDHSRTATTVAITAGSGGVVGGRAAIGATLTGGTANGLNEVTIAYRPVGTTAWTVLGTDDNAPYRVFQDVSGMAKGTLLEYRVVVKDATGRITATSTTAVVGDPAPAPGTGGGPVTQPGAVAVAGTFNTAMGCAADWAPDCAQAQLTLDPASQIWKGTYTLPAGSYGYKVAIDKAWTENYGAGGAPNGANIDMTAPATPVTFYYDHGTHFVTSDAQGPIITIPGSFQSELGCAADWMADCMRPWLQDPDGDGTYTWVTTQIPAGSYEFKVAHGLSMSENYGAGGTPNGANMAITVPASSRVTFSYVKTSHLLTYIVTPA